MMIERLLQPRGTAAEPPPDDSELLNAAIEAAGVSDYDFFRAAWRGWHGERPDDKALERVFVDYLFRQRAPGFARHFARRVLDAKAFGRLDRAAFGLDELKPVNRPKAHFCPAAHVAGYAVLVTALLPFI